MVNRYAKVVNLTRWDKIIASWVHIGEAKQLVVLVYRGLPLKVYFSRLLFTVIYILSPIVNGMIALVGVVVLVESGLNIGVHYKKTFKRGTRR